VIIKVLGPGCSSFVALERVTRDAVETLDLDATVEKIEDYPTILGYGVMSTPALVVDDKVMFSGRVPRGAQVRAILAELAC
jgi:small redox-active disulfide protein 2